MDYGQPETLEIERRADGVLAVRLNRPAVHNAFNEVMIDELRAACEGAGQDADVRAVLLTGKGKSFSAGADVAWMRAQGEADYASNRDGALRLARMFHAVWSCPKPVVAAVHGAALGGGTGLVAACDVALAAESATFGFTEVRLGIVPAVISPYAIEKLGAARARALFVQGITFGGREAERLGLVFRCHPDAELLAGAEAVLDAIKRCGPLAVRAAKELLREVAGLDPESAQERTVDTIAGIRATAEAREGLSAFLDKRPPSWT